MPKQYLINHWAILVLVIVHQLISFIWYSPYLFAFKWMNLVGFSLADVKPLDSIEFYIPFVFSILASIGICYGLAWLFLRLNVVSVWQGITIAFSCWFVFIFMATLTQALFASTSLALVWITMGRECIIFCLSGFILSLWRRQI